MKKLIIMFLVLILATGTSYAQLQKGNCFAAGYSNLGIDIGTSKTKVGGTTNENYKYSEFFFNPAAGYFITDHLVAGGFLDIYFDSYKYTGTDNKNKYSQFILGPIVRYYILSLDKFCPYAEGRLGVGIYNSKSTYSGNESKYNETYSSIRFGVGSTYFVTEGFGIDAFLGYDYDAWTSKEDEDNGVKSTASEKSTSKYGSIEFNMGLVFVISN